MHDHPAAIQPQPAATAMILRDGTDGLEVLMLERNRAVDFASGALVFPGGKVGPGDRDPGLRLDGIDALRSMGQDPSLRVAAIRETFEEAGLLFARTSGGMDCVGRKRLECLAPWATRLESGTVTLAGFLATEALTLALDLLVPLARWITPEGLPKRFDAHFFVARAPDGQRALHDGRETVASGWFRPRDLLHGAEAGRRTLVPATRANLMLLDGCPDVEAALHLAAGRDIAPITPVVVRTADGPRAVIPEDAGYPVREFPITAG